MPTLISQCNMPVTPAVEIYFLDSFEDSAWLPEGQTIVTYQAYCPITNKPVGPRGGDPNPAYVRLWMKEHHENAIECTVVTAWSVVGIEVTR